MTLLPTSTRILVVDDAAAIRVVMGAFLEKLGYAHVRTAATVEEGLAALREQASDVAFVDLMIEGASGTAFAERALLERPDLTLVVMTAHPSTHADVVGLVALGARDYLPKPIQLHRLRGVISHLAEDKEALEDEEPFEDAKAPDASYG